MKSMKMANKQLINEIAALDVMEAIGDGISIQDTSFKILYQNEIHKSLVGEHIGEFCYKAYEKREQICNGCPLAPAFKDGLSHKEERSAPTNKGVIHVEITASPLRNTSGEIIAGIELVRDITERKKAEKVIVGQERYFQDVINSIQDGVSILDQDLNIILVNRAMEKWYSHAMPLAGKKCYQAYHGINAICKKCPSMITIDTQESSYETVPKKDSNGNTVGWLDLYSFPFIDSDTGTLKGVIEYVRDITQRKLAEEELNRRVKELEEFYDMSVGREVRMKELKETVAELELKISRLKKID